MGVTLKDIANELNLSVNTISRGLRDLPDISKTTRELIQNTAKRMGYQKNMAASRLRTNKSYILGVIVTDYDNPSNNQIINGVERIASDRNYTIMVGATNNNREMEESIVSRMIKQGVDGIVLVPTMRDTEVLDIMESNGIPYVLAARKFRTRDTNYVYSDDEAGCAMVAEALYNNGHRSFLYIAATFADAVSDIRYGSFVNKLVELGLSPECVSRVYCDGTQADARIAVDKWMDENQEGRLPATAVFAFSDYSAFGCYMACKDKGYRIPEDLSVVGYDNIEFSMMLEPGLCTVDNHFFELGSSCAERLLEMVGNPEERNTVKRFDYLPELVWRKSVMEIG